MHKHFFVQFSSVGVKECKQKEEGKICAEHLNWWWMLVNMVRSDFTQTIALRLFHSQNEKHSRRRSTCLRIFIEKLEKSCSSFMGILHDTIRAHNTDTCKVLKWNQIYFSVPIKEKGSDNFFWWFCFCFRSKSSNENFPLSKRISFHCMYDSHCFSGKRIFVSFIFMLRVLCVYVFVYIRKTK